MILFDNWQISVTGLVARQYDNLSRRIDVEGNLPEGYTWQLLVQSGGNADTLLLQPTDKGVGAVLTADNLSKSGEYYFQLRGILEADGVTKRHTNVVSAYIPESLTGLGSWPDVPTEFAQVEARILELYQHPPIPGSNGYWLVWDADADEYVESQLSLPEAAAGGTSDHSKLANRDAADQHPMSAITGLEKALDGKQPTGDYLTDKDLDATLTVDGKAADAKAVGDALSTLSEEIANFAGGSGLTTAQINALDGMFKVCAFIKADVSEEYNAFRTAFDIEAATITGISATYSGGNVTAGTSVDELTGIVVTANYSDGSKRTVTGYTLSGTIAEGSNTITVTYEGMTTTFTVTGVAEEVTITSISATYSGGDVAVGTALTDLTGIVVTAHYSDGTSATVTGYTLSGKIVEGSNIITVTYGENNTTFTVTGFVETTNVEWEIGGINPQGTLNTNTARLRTTGLIPREYDSVSAKDGYELIVCCFDENGKNSTAKVYFNPNDNTVGHTGVYSSGPIDLAGIKAGTIGFTSTYSWFKILLRRTDGADMAVEEGENAVVFA